jgi:hypothetical protein
LETGEKEKSKFYMRKYTTLKDSLNISFRNDADETMTKIVKEVETKNKENSKNNGSSQEF